MKKIINKIGLIFLSIFSMFYTSVYADMTQDAIEESTRFYNENKTLIDQMSLFANALKIFFVILIIVIPIIMILNKSKDGNNKYLKIAEVFGVINVFLIFTANILLGHGSELKLYSNSFVVVVSILNFIIILFCLLKKDK